MSRRFVDFSLEDIRHMILEREPSFSELQKKTLILLRSSIVAISRLQVVFDSMNPKSHLGIDQSFARHLWNLGTATKWISEEHFFESDEKENPTAIGSSENHENSI